MLGPQAQAALTTGQQGRSYKPVCCLQHAATSRV